MSPHKHLLIVLCILCVVCTQRACLAATIRSSGASQSTIKLVATNLIANSKLLGKGRWWLCKGVKSVIWFMPCSSEGVQLLCLIDKGQDACRYLQTYGEWYHSVWLAKSTLDERDVSEVFSRWSDHLTSAGINQKVRSHTTACGCFKVVCTVYVHVYRARLCWCYCHLASSTKSLRCCTGVSCNF